jgi:hypothetical protein
MAEMKATLRDSRSSFAISNVRPVPLAVVEGAAKLWSIATLAAFDLDKVGKNLVVIAQIAGDRRLLRF